MYLTFSWLVVPGRLPASSGWDCRFSGNRAIACFDTVLAAAVGIMLAAAVFSLLVPALAFAAGVVRFAAMMLLDNVLG